MEKSEVEAAARLAVKLAALGVVLFLSLGLYILIFAGSRTDVWYNRFASPRRSSLVLGTSRAAQGIIPSVFNESDAPFARPLYNFAFASSSSPFGPIYSRAVEKKFTPGNEPSLFLIEVNPMALIMNLTGSETSGEELPEADYYLGQMMFLNIHPNVEYVLRYYPKPYYMMAIDAFEHRREEEEPWIEIEPDGWMRTFIVPDAERLEEGIQLRLKNYGEVMQSQELSAFRIASLERLIEFCQGHGAVYMIRMPCSRPIYEQELMMFPAFDSAMAEIASKHDIPYFNYASQSGDFISTDGTHLYRDSGLEVSRMILADIQKASGVGPQK